MEHIAVHPTANIHPTARLHATCSVDAHAVIGGACIIESDVLVGVRATVVPADGWMAAPGETVLKTRSVIGAGAIVSGPVTIGRGAVVRPGAVVTSDVPAHAIVAGNPATVIGYTDTGSGLSTPFIPPPHSAGESTSVAGATLVRLPKVVDVRGSLTFAEIEEGLPFEAKRVFLVFDVSNRHVRGSHAHRTLHQFLIAIGGRIVVAIDDGRERSQVHLSEPTLGLHIPPMVWATQYDYSPNAALVVLASAEYDASDYIRDYDQYLRAVVAAEG
jgi:UDP-2-acetamido-3-amino-2,3-dideoxy-glucuronate N-acetyltransferase